MQQELLATMMSSLCMTCTVSDNTSKSKSMLYSINLHFQLKDILETIWRSMMTARTTKPAVKLLMTLMKMINMTMSRMRRRETTMMKRRLQRRKSQQQQHLQLQQRLQPASGLQQAHILEMWKMWMITSGRGRSKVKKRSTWISAPRGLIPWQSSGVSYLSSLACKCGDFLTVEF